MAGSFLIGARISIMTPGTGVDGLDAVARAAVDNFVPGLVVMRMSSTPTTSASSAHLAPPTLPVTTR